MEASVTIRDVKEKQKILQTILFPLFSLSHCIGNKARLRSNLIKKSLSKLQRPPQLNISSGINRHRPCLRKQNQQLNIIYQFDNNINITSVISISNKGNPYQISWPRKVLFKWKSGLKGGGGGRNRMFFFF